MKKQMLAFLTVAIMLASLAACCKNVDNPEKEKTFKKGTIEGGVYASEDLGLSFTLEDGWKFLNDDEINGITGDMQTSIDDETLQKALKSGASIFDMCAMTTDGSDYTVNITVSDLGAAYGTDIDEDAYIRTLLKELETSLSNIGVNNLEIGTGTYTVAGTDRRGAFIKSTFQGVTHIQRFFCIRSGRYMYNITCSAPTDTESEEIISMFKEYK